MMDEPLDRGDLLTGRSTEHPWAVPWAEVQTLEASARSTPLASSIASVSEPKVWSVISGQDVSCCAAGSHGRLRTSALI